MFFGIFTIIFGFLFLISYLDSDDSSLLWGTLFFFGTIFSLTEFYNQTNTPVIVDKTPVTIETKIDDRCTLVKFYPEGKQRYQLVTKFVRCDNATVETLNTKQVGKTTKQDPITTITK